MRMKKRSRCLLVLFLQTFSLVSATSRTFASEDNTQQAGLWKKSQSPTLASDAKRLPLPDSMSEMDVSELIEESCEKESSRIGSSPPSCEHKCYGCTPCEAIQVPTTSRRSSHWGLQYANYEPEGWKCQCGPSLYSP